MWVAGYRRPPATTQQGGAARPTRCRAECGSLAGTVTKAVQVAQEFDALLARIDDPALRDDLRRSFDKVRAKRTFGLVFESHLPERVTLPSHPIRRGVRVTRRDDQRQVFFVGTVKRGIAQLIPIGTDDDSPNDQSTELPVGELVVVAEFGEPIYPGLKHLESVHRGGDKPAHTVINAENHHALELLQFTHAGKIDCIYIDPPYNTGARDWKYDNNYVDGDDSYRHSKWLAFMERRLLLARELLNPDDSVLIVTIDEKEYLRLGLLLEQTFPDARIQMVSTIINRAGSTRGGAFARTDEYLYFLRFGQAEAARVPLSDDWRVNSTDKRTTRMLWAMLNRTGTGRMRADRPAMFYPVFVTADGSAIQEVGDPVPVGVRRDEVVVPPGTVACFPLTADGREGRWQVGPETLREMIPKGYVRIGRPNPERGFTLSYLKSGEQKKVEDGTYEISGRRTEGCSRSTPAFVRETHE